jgi:hypothetical protein
MDVCSFHIFNVVSEHVHVYTCEGNYCAHILSVSHNGSSRITPWLFVFACAQSVCYICACLHCAFVPTFLRVPVVMCMSTCVCVCVCVCVC